MAKKQVCEDCGVVRKEGEPDYLPHNWVVFRQSGWYTEDGHTWCPYCLRELIEAANATQ